MDSNLYVKLSPQGTQKHKELESKCLMKFIYWVAVANISGALGGQLMMYIPMSSRQKQMRFRNGIFISTALLLSYHGYKLSKRDLRIGLRIVTILRYMLLDYQKHNYYLWRWLRVFALTLRDVIKNILQKFLLFSDIESTLPFLLFVIISIYQNQFHRHQTQYYTFVQQNSFRFYRYLIILSFLNLIYLESPNPLTRFQLFQNGN